MKKFSKNFAVLYKVVIISLCVHSTTLLQVSVYCATDGSGAAVWHLNNLQNKGWPGACRTHNISIEFEIRPKFMIYSTNHNNILDTSQQSHCRDECKISQSTVDHIPN